MNAWLSAFFCIFDIIFEFVKFLKKLVIFKKVFTCDPMAFGL